MKNRSFTYRNSILHNNIFTNTAQRICSFAVVLGRKKTEENFSNLYPQHEITLNQTFFQHLSQSHESVNTNLRVTAVHALMSFIYCINVSEGLDTYLTNVSTYTYYRE